MGFCEDTLASIIVSLPSGSASERRSCDCAASNPPRNSTPHCILRVSSYVPFDTQISAFGDPPASALIASWIVLYAVTHDVPRTTPSPSSVLTWFTSTKTRSAKNTFTQIASMPNDPASPVPVSILTSTEKMVASLITVELSSVLFCPHTSPGPPSARTVSPGPSTRLNVLIVPAPLSCTDITGVPETLVALYSILISTPRICAPVGIENLYPAPLSVPEVALAASVEVASASSLRVILVAFVQAPACETMVASFGPWEVSAKAAPVANTLSANTPASAVNPR